MDRRNQDLLRALKANPGDRQLRDRVLRSLELAGETEEADKVRFLYETPELFDKWLKGLERVLQKIQRQSATKRFEVLLGGSMREIDGGLPIGPANRVLVRAETMPRYWRVSKILPSDANHRVGLVYCYVDRYTGNVLGRGHQPSQPGYYDRPARNPSGNLRDEWGGLAYVRRTKVVDPKGIEPQVRALWPPQPARRPRWSKTIERRGKATASRAASVRAS